MLYTERMAQRKRPLNLDQVEEELRRMHSRTRLYDIVKAEMIRRDRWKFRARGDSFKKGEDERRKPLHDK